MIIWVLRVFPCFPIVRLINNPRVCGYHRRSVLQLFESLDHLRDYGILKRDKQSYTRAIPKVLDHKDMVISSAWYSQLFRPPNTPSSRINIIEKSLWWSAIFIFATCHESSAKTKICPSLINNKYFFVKVVLVLPVEMKHCVANENREGTTSEIGIQLKSFYTLF